MREAIMTWLRGPPLVPSPWYEKFHTPYEKGACRQPTRERKRQQRNIPERGAQETLDGVRAAHTVKMQAVATMDALWERRAKARRGEKEGGEREREREKRLKNDNNNNSNNKWRLSLAPHSRPSCPLN